ncbi:MAG: hypothetical protein V1773_18275 [bacterium]
MLLKFKVLLFVLSLIMLNNNYAQETIKRSGGLARIMSMGDNLYIEDPTDMKINPAYGAYYDNFIWGDIGKTTYAGGSGGTSQFFGANLRLDENLTIGAILSREDQAGSISISSVDPLYLSSQGYFGNERPNNNTEIFASYKLSNLSLGFGISYLSAGSKIEYNNVVNHHENRDYSQIGFNFGLLTKLSTYNSIDAAILLLLPKSRRELDSLTEEVSQTVFKADVRAFIRLNEKIKFVPVFNLLLGSGSDDIVRQVTANTFKNKDLPSYTQLLVGAGINYSTDKFLFAGGPSFIYILTKDDSDDPEREYSKTAIEWNIGAEWYCTTWLTARMGYKAYTSSDFAKTKYELGSNNESTRTNYGNDDGFTLGIGFKFEGFSLDATVNDDIIRQGLNNIGGGNATLGFVSVSYAF